MKKTGLLSIALSLSLFSCSEKTVELTLMDILTGGKIKEWKIEEFYISGENTVKTQECFFDDTAVFSKGNPSDTLYSGPVYTWKKNDKKCGLTDEDLVRSFIISDDGKQLLFENGVESWEIDILTPKEVLIYLTLDPNVKMRLKSIDSDSTNNLQ